MSFERNTVCIMYGKYRIRLHSIGVESVCSNIAEINFFRSVVMKNQCTKANHVEWNLLIIPILCYI